MAPSPRKVLFVEDEAALQYSYERFFEGKYTMAYAPNGAEAMRQLSTFQPDVLVLDMRLPDTDRIALLHRLRETQLTVRENLRFWASLYGVSVPGELLSRLGLEEHADRPVRALSRGLVQRVAIARALLHDPTVLLLDEPFTGLDRVAAEALSRLLAQHGAAGRATVLVAHHVAEGTGLATDVAFMRAGRFVHFAPRAGRGPQQVGEEYRNAIA